MFPPYFYKFVNLNFIDLLIITNSSNPISKMQVNGMLSF